MYIVLHCTTMTATAVYNSMIADILNAMLGYVSLQDILQKIIQVRHFLTRSQQCCVVLFDSETFPDTITTVLCRVV